MRHQAHHVGDDADGAASGADIVDGGPGYGVDLEKVGAVDAGAFEAFVAGGELVGGAAGRLILDRDRDGIFIILNKKQNRRLATGGPVERLVKVALRRGAVAAGAIDVGVVVEPLNRQAEAEPRQPLGADRRGDRQDVFVRMAEVLGHLAPARVRAVGLGQVVEQRLLDRLAQRQGHAQVSVIHREPVVAGTREQAHGRLRRLVAAAADVEKSLALLNQRQHLLVETPGCDHGAIDRVQRLLVEICRADGLDVQGAFVDDAEG